MPRRLATLLLVASLALVGCGHEDDGHDTRPKTNQYVAMGDSYTSGPGIPTIVHAGCFRSDHNYPSLVAAELELDLDDVSCGGAATTALTGPQDTTDGQVPPQLKALSTDTDYVTLGIGGNDEGLFGDLLATCIELGQQHLPGAPCRDLMTEGGGDKVLETIDLIKGRLTASLRDVERRAPHAEVFLVGYPQLAPRHGRCDALPLSPGDYSYMREVMTALGAATAQASAAAGAHYIDLLHASAGHDICAGPDAWIAGITPDPDRPSVSMHPYGEEQEAVARMIVDAISKNS